jgi:hypothetical protein
LYLLGTTYRSVLQQMLKMSTAFVLVRLCEVFVGQCWQQSVQCCVSVTSSFVGFSNKLSFWEMLAERFDGMKSGDRGGQRPCKIVRSPENSCSRHKAVVESASFFRRRCGPTHKSASSVAGHVFCLMYFLCPEMYFSLCVLSYSALPCRIRIAKQFTTSRKRILRMDTYSSFTYTIVIFAPVQLRRICREQWPSNWGDLGMSVMGMVGQSVTRGVDLILISFLWGSTWLFLGCVSNDIPCTSTKSVNGILWK